MAYGISALEICTFRLAQEYKKTATLSDYIPATTEEMGNHFLRNIDMNAAGRYPFTVDFTK